MKTSVNFRISNIKVEAQLCVSVIFLVIFTIDSHLRVRKRWWFFAVGRRWTEITQASALTWSPHTKLNNRRVSLGGLTFNSPGSEREHQSPWWFPPLTVCCPNTVHVTALSVCRRGSLEVWLMFCPWLSSVHLCLFFFLCCADSALHPYPLWAPGFTACCFHLLHFY